MMITFSKRVLFGKTNEVIMLNLSINRGGIIEHRACFNAQSAWLTAPKPHGCWRRAKKKGAKRPEPGGPHVPFPLPWAHEPRARSHEL